MARRLVTTLGILLSVACQKPVEPPAVPARETIAIRYVAVPSLDVHAKPDPAAEIVSTYPIGETVSIYAEQDGWAEIAVGLDASGWVEANALSETRDAVTSSAEPRFHLPPMPVVSPGGITGEIILEASVNTTGEITDIKTLRNTTGSDALEQENIRALRKARFFPLVRNGRTEPFVYEHRVSY